MGTLTLSELRGEVSAYLANRDDLDEARLTRFLNLAQVRLARAYSWVELHKGSSSTASFNNNDQDRFINLPENLRSVRSFVLLDGTLSRKLDYVPPRDFDRHFSGYLAQGRRRPVVYTKWREVIELMPLPERQYRFNLRWVKWPDPLSDPDQPSEFDGKDELLILLAASIANTSIARFDRSKELFGVAMNILERTIKDEEVEPDQEIKPITEHGMKPGDYWKNPFIKGIK